MCFPNVNSQMRMESFSSRGDFHGIVHIVTAGMKAIACEFLAPGVFLSSGRVHFSAKWWRRGWGWGLRGEGVGGIR